MTLEEYYDRCNSIESDYPPEKGLDLLDRMNHYRKIKDGWKKELSQKDLKIVLERNKRFSERMS